MNKARIAVFAASVALLAGSAVIACGNDDAGGPGYDADAGGVAPDGAATPTPEASTDSAADARETGPDGSAPCSADGWCRAEVPDSGGASYELHSVSARAPDDVWAGGGRLLHFDGSAWSTVPMPGDPLIQSVLTLPTSILVSANDGVHRRDADGTWHLEYGGEPFQSFYARGSVLRAAPSNGQVWLAVSDLTPLTSLYRRSLTGPTWTRVTVPDALGGVRDISIDASGNIWAAADFAVGQWTAATSKWVVNSFLDPFGERNALAIAGGPSDVWLGGTLDNNIVRPKVVGGAITLAVETLNSPTALAPAIESVMKTGDNAGWAVGSFVTYGDDPIDGLITKTLPLALVMKGGVNTIERLFAQGGFEIGDLHGVWASTSEVWAVGGVGGSANTAPSELIFHKTVAR